MRLQVRLRDWAYYRRVRFVTIMAIFIVACVSCRVPRLLGRRVRAQTQVVCGAQPCFCPLWRYWCRAQRFETVISSFVCFCMLGLPLICVLIAVLMREYKQCLRRVNEGMYCSRVYVLSWSL